MSLGAKSAQSTSMTHSVCGWGTVSACVFVWWTGMISKNILLSPTDCTFHSTVQLTQCDLILLTEVSCLSDLSFEHKLFPPHPRKWRVLVPQLCQSAKLHYWHGKHHLLYFWVNSLHLTLTLLPNIYPGIAKYLAATRKESCCNASIMLMLFLCL